MGAAMGYPRRNAAPLHLDQDALVRSEENARGQRIHAERQSELLHILDTNETKRAAGKIGGSPRHSVHFKQTLLVTHFERFDNALTAHDSEITTVAAPNKHHTANEMGRQIRCTLDP